MEERGEGGRGGKERGREGAGCRMGKGRGERREERGERREERVGGRGEGNTPESLGSARYASQRGGRQETCSWS